MVHNHPSGFWLYTQWSATRLETTLKYRSYYANLGVTKDHSRLGAQGLIGNVAPRNLFAIFQSAAMGGYGIDILGSVTNMFSALLGGGAFARFVYSAFGQAREAGNGTYAG